MFHNLLSSSWLIEKKKMLCQRWVRLWICISVEVPGKMLDPDPFSISIFDQVRIYLEILNPIGLQASVSKGSPLNFILIKFVWLFFYFRFAIKILRRGATEQHRWCEGRQAGTCLSLKQFLFLVRIRRRKQWCGSGLIFFPIWILSSKSFYIRIRP